MTVVKTSQAVILTARLNPVNPEEATALNYLNEQRELGLNFKQVIVDALNHRAGMTPEMYTHEYNSQLHQFARLTEDALSQFTEQVLSELRTSGVNLPQSALEQDDDGAPVSKFTKGFMKSIKQRQEQTYEDIDE